MDMQGSFFEMDDGKTVSNLNAPIVFNIGYQGHTIQTFIKRLREYKIELLVDLRSKPYSRNADFNRKNVEKQLKNFGIKYLWRGKVLGGMGVSPAIWRKTLDPLSKHATKEVICLMCMEKNINQCHRKDLSKILREEFKVQTFNI